MAEEIVINSFSPNALTQIEHFLGVKSGTIKNNIVSSSNNTSNTSSNPDNNEEKLQTLQDKIDKLRKESDEIKKGLKESFTKKFREEVETDAKQRREYRKSLKEDNAIIEEKIKLLENETKLIQEKLKDEEKYQKAAQIVNQEFELRNQMAKQHLDYVKEHLEKYEAIAKVQEKIASHNQKIDDRVDNRSHGNIFGGEKGKVNSFAEIFSGIGNLEKKIYNSFNGETIGRNIVKGIAGTANIASKGAAFVNAGKMDVGAIADKMSSKLSQAGPYGAAAGGFIQVLKTAFEMYNKVNTAASKFGRTVGGGGKAIREMEMRLAKVADNISHTDSKWVSFNQRAYDAAKLIETMVEYSNKLGKNTQYMSQDEIKSLQDLKDWGIDMDFVSQFETFGIQSDEVTKRLAKLYGTAGKHGLNVKAVTDVVVKNMKMAQQYTFAGGQKALERMAEKAVALKYNMESVAKFAEKVSTLEGAAKAGAELSVLGGDFARMGNPLSLLYGGLQDPERLNDMMLNMTKNMAYWDSKKGQMDISADNRIRMRAAATSIGVDYNDLYSQALNQGKRNIIDRDLGGTSLDKDTREFVRNIARIKDGKAVVSLKTGEKDEDGNDVYKDRLVSSLNEDDRKQLKEESEKKDTKEGGTIGDLIIETQSTQEKLDEIINQIKTKLVYGVMALVNKLVFGRDAYSLMFNDEQNAQYNRLKDILSTTGKVEKIKNRYRDASDEDKKALQEMGIFNEYGEYTGKATKDRVGLSKMYSYAEVSDLFAKVIGVNNHMYEKKAFGGEIRGSGTSRSDSIPAMLSDGEFVMNARAAQQHLPTLKAWNNAGAYANGGLIKAGNNQTNYQPVYNSIDRLRDRNSQTNAISIDPININISGTINLTGGGNTKSFDVKDVLNNPTIISQLVRRIEESVNYGLDKHKVHMKYPEPIIV